MIQDKKTDSHHALNSEIKRTEYYYLFDKEKRTYKANHHTLAMVTFKLNEGLPVYRQVDGDKGKPLQVLCLLFLLLHLYRKEQELPASRGKLGDRLLWSLSLLRKERSKSQQEKNRVFQDGLRTTEKRLQIDLMVFPLKYGESPGARSHRTQDRVEYAR